MAGLILVHDYAECHLSSGSDFQSLSVRKHPAGIIEDLQISALYSLIEADRAESGRLEPADEGQILCHGLQCEDAVHQILPGPVHHDHGHDMSRILRCFDDLQAFAFVDRDRLLCFTEMARVRFSIVIGDGQHAGSAAFRLDLQLMGNVILHGCRNSHAVHQREGIGLFGLLLFFSVHDPVLEELAAVRNRLDLHMGPRFDPLQFLIVLVRRDLGVIQLHNIADILSLKADGIAALLGNGFHTAGGHIIRQREFAALALTFREFLRRDLRASFRCRYRNLPFRVLTQDESRRRLHFDLGSLRDRPAFFRGDLPAGLLQRVFSIVDVGSGQISFQVQIDGIPQEDRIGRGCCVTHGIGLGVDSAGLRCSRREGTGSAVVLPAPFFEMPSRIRLGSELHLGSLQHRAAACKGRIYAQFTLTDRFIRQGVVFRFEAGRDPDLAIGTDGRITGQGIDQKVSPALVLGISAFCFDLPFLDPEAFCRKRLQGDLRSAGKADLVDIVQQDR